MIEQIKEFLNSLTVGKIITEEDHALLAYFYQQATGLTPDCTTCPGAFKRLKNDLAQWVNDQNKISLTPKKPSIMGQFKAKKSVLIFDDYKQVHVKSDTATDEEILSILAGRAGAIKYFDGPADWKDQVKEFQKKREAAIKAKKDKEAPKEKAPAKTSQTMAQALGVLTLEAAIAEISKGTKKGLTSLAKKMGLEFKGDPTIEQMKAVLQEVAAKEFGGEPAAKPGVEVDGVFKAFEDMAEDELREAAEALDVEILEGDTREVIIAKLSEVTE